MSQCCVWSPCLCGIFTVRRNTCHPGWKSRQLLTSDMDWLYLHQTLTLERVTESTHSPTGGWNSHPHNYKQTRHCSCWRNTRVGLCGWLSQGLVFVEWAKLSGTQLLWLPLACSCLAVVAWPCILLHFGELKNSSLWCTGRRGSIFRLIIVYWI